MLCIATMGLTTSCTKDNEELIVGTWQQVTKDGNIFLDDPEGEYWSSYLIFLENGRVREEYSCYNRDYDTYSERYFLDVYDYSINGDILTIIDKDDLIKAQIKKLNKKHLVFTVIEQTRDWYEEETVYFNRI